MAGIGWALLLGGCVLAILVWLGFLPEGDGELYTSGAWIMIFFGVVILLFEAAFGKRKK